MSNAGRNLSDLNSPVPRWLRATQFALVQIQGAPGRRICSRSGRLSLACGSPSLGAPRSRGILQPNICRTTPTTRSERARTLSEINQFESATRLRMILSTTPRVGIRKTWIHHKSMVAKVWSACSRVQNGQFSLVSQAARGLTSGRFCKRARRPEACRHPG